MEVSTKGLCRYCKHAAVFNVKEDLAICTKYYHRKDAPDTLECITSPEDTRAIYCPGYEERKKEVRG